jgi:hypothetical protein
MIECKGSHAGDVQCVACKAEACRSSVSAAAVANMATEGGLVAAVSLAG